MNKEPVELTRDQAMGLIVSGIYLIIKMIYAFVMTYYEGKSNMATLEVRQDLDFFEKRVFRA